MGWLGTFVDASSVAEAEAIEERFEQVVVQMLQVGRLVGDLQSPPGFGRRFVRKLLEVLSNRSGVQIQIQVAQATLSPF